MAIRIGQAMTLFGTIISLGACGGGGGGGSGNNPVRTIIMATPSGNAQTDTIGAPLATELRVEVTEDGSVKQGITINWSALTGGGQVTPASSVTGADGVAATTWTLGNTLGAQSAQATLGGAGGSPVTFTATAGKGRPHQLTVSAGDGQIALRNASFAGPVAVRVDDRLGNSLTGVTVNWAVGSGPLTLGAATSVSNALGLASMTMNAGGTAGSGTILASTAGVPGPVAFNLTISPAARLVNVGAGVLFRSARNNSQNPAVDTVQAGEAVIWVHGGDTHNVESVGVPSFTSSPNMTVAGQSYTLSFSTPGTYQYECLTHPNGLMSGRVEVE